jgi:hypothetical protein
MHFTSYWFAYCKYHNISDIIHSSVRDVVGTGSNFATSGGFGPKVATIMGLGLFVFCSQLFSILNLK